jgi:hypothetical protein
MISAGVLLLVGCGVRTSATHGPPTLQETNRQELAQVLDRTTATRIAQKIANECARGNFVLSAGTRGAGLWAFLVSFPDDRSTGAHFFIYVKDDGSTKVKSGL